MPDFERLTDKLMLDLAKTPEQTAYAQGYVAGKTRARKEIALIVAFVDGVFLLTLAFVVAHYGFFERLST